MTVSILSVQPPLGAVNVSRFAEIAFTVKYTGAPAIIPVSEVTVVIDGQLAFDGDFVRPNFWGKVFLANSVSLSMRIEPRRAFLYNVKPQIVVSIPVTLLGPETTSITTLTFDFQTHGQPSRILDASFKNTRVDQPFVEQPATEMFRQRLLSSLKPTSASAAIVQLYYRVSNSSLRSLLYLTGDTKTAVEESKRLRSSDIASVDDVFATISTIDVLWETALKELLRLGVDEGSVQPLFQAGQSANRIEKLGAACALVLIVAERLKVIENPPVFRVVNQTV